MKEAFVAALLVIVARTDEKKPKFRHREDELSGNILWKITLSLNMTPTLSLCRCFEMKSGGGLSAEIGTAGTASSRERGSEFKVHGD